MSFKRSRVEIQCYPKTKNVTVRIEYLGDLESDPSIAKESILLLIGDAWHDYAMELNLDPVKTMKIIAKHTSDERKKS